MLFLAGARYEDYEKEKLTRRHPPICRRGFTRCWVVVGLG